MPPPPRDFLDEVPRLRRDEPPADPLKELDGVLKLLESTSSKATRKPEGGRSGAAVVEKKKRSATPEARGGRERSREGRDRDRDRDRRRSRSRSRERRRSRWVLI